MAQLCLIKQAGSILVPATPSDLELVQAMPIGTFLELHATAKRNPKFHRRFFALLNLGFDYWQPTGGSLSPQERYAVTKYNEFLVANGGNREVMLSAAEVFLNAWAGNRASRIVDIVKSFEAYRRWAIVEAGFFTEMTMPNGRTHREPMSIKFSKMDELTFQELYKSVFNVLWRDILSRTFHSEAEVENTVNQLMELAA
ncbi:DUF1367 family protein [uncultured Tolumonas sp.]|jgi:Protein of unknown function (DUF1367).|uniref:DUF1367 family protein n=1 Tax=uncultured Tolumonas sp. TaxID=263765 RepID=UPI002A0A7E9E|nr:DUF1367 family protein [uncultured Tolumonas sp.]